MINDDNTLYNEMTHRALLDLLDSINFPPFFATVAFEVVVLLVEVPELEEVPLLLVIGANTSADGAGIVIPTL